MLPIIENEIVSIYRHLYNGGLSIPQVSDMRERVYALHSLMWALEDSWAVKTCSCGRQYSAKEWLALPLVGYQTSPSLGGEMRNCVCNSTMLLTTRKTAYSEPKAKMLRSTIIGSLLVRDTRPPFTLGECMRISEAYCMSEYQVYFDKWNEVQLLEAAYEGKTPEWNIGNDGRLIAVH